MMIYAVGKPDTLQINLKGLEIVIVMRHAHIGVYRLQHLANAKIVLSVLVKSNIPSKKSRLRQIIH